MFVTILTRMVTMNLDQAKKHPQETEELVFSDSSVALFVPIVVNTTGLLQLAVTQQKQNPKHDMTMWQLKLLEWKGCSMNKWEL